MKKLLSLLLVGVLSFCLVACGNTSQKNNNTSSNGSEMETDDTNSSDVQDVDITVKIRDLEIVLGDTTFGELKPQLMKNYCTYDYIGYYCEFKAETTGYDQLIISVATPEPNTLTKIEDCVVVGVRVSEFGGGSVTVNDIRLRKDIVWSEIKETVDVSVFENDTYYFNFYSDDETSINDTSVIKSFVYGCVTSQYHNENGTYDIEKEGIKFSSQEPVFTDNKAYEFAINGSVYTVGVSTFRDLFSNESVFMADNACFSEHDFEISRLEFEYNVPINVFCPDGRVGRIEVSFTNMTDTDVSIYDAVISCVEYKSSNFASGIIACGGLAYDENNPIVKEDVIALLGEPNFITEDGRMYYANENVDDVASLLTYQKYVGFSFKSTGELGSIKIRQDKLD